MTEMFSLDLNAGGSTAFPFNAPGDSVTGTITAMEELQQTDMQSGELLFWDNGAARMMYRVELQTQLSVDQADDGKRSVYLRGSKKPESKSSLAAVLSAVRQATGHYAITQGGQLTLTYVGDGPQAKRGFNPPKQYEARYVPPAMDLSGEAPQPQQAPAQSMQQHLAQQPPAQPYQQPPQAPGQQYQQAPIQQPPAQPIQQWQQPPAQQAPAPAQPAQQPEQAMMQAALDNATPAPAPAQPF